MLIDFFLHLRKAKLPVSIKEYLMLIEALGRGVIGGDKNDPPDPGMPVEGIDRPLRDRLARKGAPLLGKPTARAQPAARRDDQRGDAGVVGSGVLRHVAVIGAGRAPHNGARCLLK